MKLQELHGFLEESLEYPTDLQSVRTSVGDVILDAPDDSDSQSISAILSTIEHDTYASPSELYDAIIANLPDGYVGRKYYSDRGGHTEGEVEGWADGPDQSF